MQTLQQTATHRNTLQQLTNKTCTVICKCTHVTWTTHLQHTATHCITLQHTATTHKQNMHSNMQMHTRDMDYSPATHCNPLQHTASHYNTLQHTATHCNTLQHTATRCSTPQHTRHGLLNCNTLQPTATHCNTLHHTATHCNTLQHTATRCSTLQQPTSNEAWAATRKESRGALYSAPAHMNESRHTYK